ncbi:hypothetical protein DICSQDRAFT_128290 [Dichomitus squalens LYAD-421 SS1]|uniref:Uncharacterized protein n=1 Tax=Dichomitus squalens (strain LYAD-421) TaxID=732165 RepID=R7SU32_DICSQ|nr:uncharacterized protein DICSQDRAFT_128290 [Dichomitus squalens LYAD-421 SS1]EJF59428.1 hypothetical protein DICSQDRAFT_128290 [Dichomitus squalens LYAD-421 SS1]
MPEEGHTVTCLSVQRVALALASPYHTAMIALRRLFCCSSHLPSSPNVLGTLSNEGPESDGVTDSVGTMEDDPISSSSSEKDVRGLDLQEVSSRSVWPSQVTQMYTLHLKRAARATVLRRSRKYAWILDVSHPSQPGIRRSLGQLGYRRTSQHSVGFFGQYPRSGSSMGLTPSHFADTFCGFSATRGRSRTTTWSHVYVQEIAAEQLGGEWKAGVARSCGKKAETFWTS